MGEHTIGIRFLVKNGGVDFSLDKLKVTVEPDQPTTLTWTLEKDGTDWDTNGVVFGTDWTSRGLPQPTLQDNSYTVSYRNETGKTNGSFKYTINVKRTDGPDKLSLDPEVQNQPPTSDPGDGKP